MTDQGAKPRKWLTASIGLVVLAVIAASTYVYRIEQQQQAVDVGPLIDEGIAQFREEQYEQSLQTLGSIPEGSVQDWHIPYYMGSALIQLKEFESAILQLEKAHLLNPNEKNIPFALGVAYYKLGNLSLSKAYFAAVLEIDPGHEEAKGLMDIMASLERIQPGAENPEPEQSPESKIDK